MNYFLAKTDPQTYSIEDLAREKQTVWDGVNSPQAAKSIQAMQPDDIVLIYHSQGQAAIVGIAKVITPSRVDPNNSKSWVTDFQFIRKLDTPVTLTEIKETHQFDDWSLVKQGRLSTMTVPFNFIEWLNGKGINL